MSNPDSLSADEGAETIVAVLQDAVLSARLELEALRDQVDTVVQAQADEISALTEANADLADAAEQTLSAAASCQRALKAATQRATADPLTGLPNRILLLDRLQHDMAIARRHSSQLALLFVDLNNFKRINDNFGHASGDAVLKIVASRLSAAVRETDTVSRHGGDEFLILLPEIQGPEHAGVIAETLLRLLNQPCQVGSHSFRLHASIGISLFPQDGDDAEALIDCADNAMYRSKRQGLGTHVYFHELQGGPG